MLEDFGQSLPITHDNKLDLVTMISNEFGTARSVARIQVKLGEIRIGGEKYESGDPLFIPMALVKGKTVEIQGPDRRWKVEIADES